MIDRDIDFEVRVRLRRNATSETVIQEMVAEGFDELDARRAMAGLLQRRRDRKNNGLLMFGGGMVLFVIGAGSFLMAIFSGGGAGSGLLVKLAMGGGIALIAKGGSDAFSF